jgi:hypothetical protein
MIHGMSVWFLISETGLGENTKARLAMSRASVPWLLLFVGIVGLR